MKPYNERSEQIKSKLFPYFLILGSIFLLFIFINGLIIIFTPLNRKLCKREKRKADLELTGTIKRIYLDSNNHNAPTLSLETDNGIKKTAFLAGDINGTFEKLSIGDSIIKKRGSLEMIVVRKSNLYSLDLDYNCNIN